MVPLASTGVGEDKTGVTPVEGTGTGIGDGFTDGGVTGSGTALSSPRVAADAGNGSASRRASSHEGGDAVYVGDSSSSSETATYLVSKDLIESLVFVSSAAAPRACIALLVAPQYVLVPAHCLAQVDPQASVSEWTVSFGFKAVP